MSRHWLRVHIRSVLGFQVQTCWYRGAARRPAVMITEPCARPGQAGQAGSCPRTNQARPNPLHTSSFPFLVRRVCMVIPVHSLLDLCAPRLLSPCATSTSHCKADCARCAHARPPCSAYAAGSPSSSSCKPDPQVAGRSDDRILTLADYAHTPRPYTSSSSFRPHISSTDPACTARYSCSSSSLPSSTSTHHGSMRRLPRRVRWL
jgi:hypothetical protein